MQKLYSKSQPIFAVSFVTLVTMGNIVDYQRVNFLIMFLLSTKCYKKSLKNSAHHAVHGTSATILEYEIVYLVTAESPSTLPVESSIFMIG